MWASNLPLRSVDTPVAYKPLDATAREPPRSTVGVNGKHIERSPVIPILAIEPGARNKGQQSLSSGSLAGYHTPMNDVEPVCMLLFDVKLEFYAPWFSSSDSQLP